MGYFEVLIKSDILLVICKRITNSISSFVKFNKATMFEDIRLSQDCSSKPNTNLIKGHSVKREQKQKLYQLFTVAINQHIPAF